MNKTELIAEVAKKCGMSKKDALVELTLPKDANIYATAYQLYLPDKALLQAKLKEWIEEYNEIHNEEK